VTVNKPEEVHVFRAATVLVKTDLAIAYLACKLHTACTSMVMQAVHGSQLSLDQLKPEEDKRTASSSAHAAALHMGLSSSSSC